jgi:hypothetical protein
VATEALGIAVALQSKVDLISKAHPLSPVQALQQHSSLTDRQSSRTTFTSTISAQEGPKPAFATVTACSSGRAPPAPALAAHDGQRFVAAAQCPQITNLKIIVSFASCFGPTLQIIHSSLPLLLPEHL